MESNKKAVKGQICKILEKLTDDQLERVLNYVHRIWR